MNEAARGSASSLPTPGLEARAAALDAQQRQQLFAAFHASKRSANQVLRSSLHGGPEARALS